MVIFSVRAQDLTPNQIAIRGTSLYTIVDGPNWAQAEANAEKLGGKLAIITSQEENNFLVETFREVLSGQWPSEPTRSYAWIGVKRVSGNWIYADDLPVSYAPWAPEQPDAWGTSNDYVILNLEDPSSMTWDGRWDDVTLDRYGTAAKGIAEIPIVKRGNYAYAIVPGPSWEEAQSNAKKLGGNLVTINNQAENDWLYETFKNAGRSPLSLQAPTQIANATFSFWIGATDKQVEGIWRTPEGEPIPFSNWDPGEPNNVDWYDPAGEDYAVIAFRDPAQFSAQNQAKWGDLGALSQNSDQAFSGIAEIAVPNPDLIPPLITLIGADPLEVYRGSVFTDPGATVTDNVDATRAITGTGTVDTTAVGMYTVTYTAQDAAGNLALPVTRTVNVVLDPAGDEDGDGLTNGQELALGTNPYQKDSDGDGVNDPVEVADGTNPNNSSLYNALNKDLVAFFPLNGNTQDASGNGRHANAVAVTSANGLAGQTNGSYRFNGTNSYLSAAGIPVPTNNAFTWSLWLNPESDKPYQAILERAQALGNGALSPFLFLTPNRSFQFTSYPPGDWGLSSPSFAYATNRWVHVALTSDPNGLRQLFVDGVKAGERTTSEYGHPLELLLIGADRLMRPASVEDIYYQGRMDEIRIYGRTLSPEEVAQLYLQDAPPPDTQPPVITLLGPSLITHLSGPFSDPGATVTDNVDSPRTIYGTGTVDAYTHGTYQLSYTASDAAGNPASPVTRTVQVVPFRTQLSARIIVDNHFALFVGTTNTITRFVGHNGVAWEQQGDLTLDLGAGEEAIYILAMGGNQTNAPAGAENLCGSINGIDLAQVPNLQKSSNLDAFLTGYAAAVNANQVAEATYSVDFEDVCAALPALSWGPAVPESGLGVPTSRGFSQGFSFDSGRAVLFRVTLSDLLTPAGDQDSDGLTNAQELNMGTDPFRKDSDGDGVNDPVEVADGTEPNNSASFKNLNQGLVAYYPFEQNLLDRSGNGNHLLAGATNVVFTNSPFADSRRALASPVSTLQSVAGTGMTGNQAHTVSLWFKSAQVPVWPSQGSLLAFGDLSGRVGGGVGVGADNYSGSGGRIVYDGRWTVLEALNVGTGWAGTWNHMAFVYTGSVSGSKIYLNGVDLQATPWSYGGGSNQTDTMNLGDGPILILPQFAGGSIAEVRLYNRALPQNEVSQLYQPDTDAPVITLTGENPMEIYKGSLFTDPGATVTDNVDATRAITGTGTVDTTTVGIFTLTYTAQDAAGNLALPVTRTVNVVLDPAGDEDGDGLVNGQELTLGTSPYQKDTDGDGVNDPVELADGTDPNNPASLNSLNQALVVHYPFRGNLLDASGNANHLTNGTSGMLLQDGLPGSEGQSLLFSGASDSIQSMRNLGISGNEAHTISVWFKASQVPAWSRAEGALLTVGQEIPNGGMGIFSRLFVDDLVNPSGRIVSHGGSTDLEALHAATNYVTRWNHLAVVYTGSVSGSKIYLNGVDTQATPWSGGNWMDSRNLIDGPVVLGRSPMTEGMKAAPGGQLTDVRVYHRALSGNEIGQLYAVHAAFLDSDGDGFNDTMENYYESDPNDPNVTPNSIRPAGRLVAWGETNNNFLLVPTNQVVDVSARGTGVAVTTEGSLVAWGRDTAGETTQVPSGITNATQVAVGHSHCVALKGDGTVISWGDLNHGLGNVPTGLKAVQVAASWRNTAAVATDGKVHVWGVDYDGQMPVPSAATNAQQVAMGWGHVLVLKKDGTVMGWGRNVDGECNIPPGLANVVQVGAQDVISWAVKRDGTVAVWGRSVDDNLSIPSDLLPIRKMAGGGTMLAVQTNGLIRAWGEQVPGNFSPPANLSNIVAVSLGPVAISTSITDGPPAADTEAPVITLNGVNPMEIYKGSTFTDPGATVTDNVDATRTITGSGAVDTSTVGMYTVTYTAQDAAGNLALPVTRTVNVVLDPATDEDGDGLTNGQELTLGTNPYEKDTDSDGVNDPVEVADGTDPLVPTSCNSSSQGLLAWYRFENNTLDSSGNQHHAINSHIQIVSSRFAGNSSKAVSFNGLNSQTYVYAQNIFTNPAIQSQFTFSLWVKPGPLTTSSGGYRVLLQGTENVIDGVNTPATPYLYVYNDNSIFFGSYLGAEVRTPSNEILRDDWNQVVVRGNNGTKQIFVDIYNRSGHFTSTFDIDSSVELWPRMALADLIIGADRHALINRPDMAQDNLVGEMDDVRVYDRMLSDSEVTQLNTIEAPPADTEAPVITLNGVNPMEIYKGSTFIDPGATVTDNKDPARTISGVGTVNTSVVSTNTITYDAVDAAGNPAVTVTRTVLVALDPSADEDGDGLSNGQEVLLGSDPLVPDSNSDGIGDGRAYLLGYSPMLDLLPLLNSLRTNPVSGLYTENQFVSNREQGRADVTGNPALYNLFTQMDYDANRVVGRNEVIQNPNPFGLYFTNQVYEMSIGKVLLTRTNDGFVLNYQIEQSEDLVNWAPYQINQVHITNAPTNKMFLRVRASE